MSSTSTTPRFRLPFSQIPLPSQVTLRSSVSKIITLEMIMFIALSKYSWFNCSCYWTPPFHLEPAETWQSDSSPQENGFPGSRGCCQWKETRRRWWSTWWVVAGACEGCHEWLVLIVWCLVFIELSCMGGMHTLWHDVLIFQILSKTLTKLQRQRSTECCSQ